MSFRPALPICVLPLIAAAFTARPVAATNPVTWQVEISTTGQDVFWTSPTILTPGLPQYDWSYEITKLTANVLLLGDQDLLGLLEQTSGAGTAGSLPLVLYDEVFNESTTGSSAHVRIEVDAAGVGHASATQIQLGSVFGLPIRRVDLAATVEIIGVPTGDYDRDGVVDLADYDHWQAGFGSMSELAADGNLNGVVDAADYVVWRKNLGIDTTSSAAIVAIPEPTGRIALVPLAVVFVLHLGRWRRLAFPRRR